MIISKNHGRRLPSVLLWAIRQDSYAKPVAWGQPLQTGSQTQGAIEIAAERDGVCIATLRRVKLDIGIRSSKDGNQVPGGGLALSGGLPPARSTRQDAQINYLSTLSIFKKQTTYLATLPNPNLKTNECHCL
jgi:hypothetical protein